MLRRKLFSQIRFIFRVGGFCEVLERVVAVDLVVIINLFFKSVAYV